MPDSGTLLLSQDLEDIHYRLLWLIYRRADGIMVRDLIREMKERGWCEPHVTAEDLGCRPDDILRRPRAPANEA